MSNVSRLLSLKISNIGCVGPTPIEIALDRVVCLVGRNNVGKSTILRAYELARGTSSFNPTVDRCRWAPEGQPSRIELDVHIPDGIANVDSRWKVANGDDRVVRSRWEWSPRTAYQKTRTTWDPSAETWADDGKAGGADNVFNSRLPLPLRVGSLDDAIATEELLLALALDPFVAQMSEQERDRNSALSQSVQGLVGLVENLATAHRAHFDSIASEVQKSFVSIFPSLGVRLNIGMAEPSIKLRDLLKTGSGIRICEGHYETQLSQQGTGARRALFWSMLQVHNELRRKADLRAELKRPLLTKLKKTKEESERAHILEQLSEIDKGDKAPADASDPALPGYLLLVDEPENALHPMAARLAQKHLYEIGQDPNWQVMMTTHSPYFVNPLEDHTTIVRLQRVTDHQGTIQLKTYRAETVEFDSDEKRQLAALQQMDVGFSEIFFGSYPVLVEGDTEHAAFLASAIEQGHKLAAEVAVIRARGKAILPALIRMLRHFKIDFGVLHDSDWPYVSKSNKAAAMFGVNQSIYDEIKIARSEGVRVRHRCSIPDFERFLGNDQLASEKPLEAYLRIKKDEALAEQVRSLFEELCVSDSDQPFAFDEAKQSFRDALQERVVVWAKANGESSDPRLNRNKAITTAKEPGAC